MNILARFMAQYEEDSSIKDLDILLAAPHNGHPEDTIENRLEWWASKRREGDIS